MPNHTESQHLERPIRSLPEEEPHEADLKRKPVAICNQPFPGNILQSNRVIERGKKPADRPNS